MTGLPANIDLERFAQAGGIIHLPSGKATEAMQAVILGKGTVRWSKRDYKAFSDEGYKLASIVFACVRAIVTRFVELPIRLYEHAPDGTRTEVTDHAALALLERPQMDSYMSRAELKEAWASYLLIAGNSYLHAPPKGELPNRSGPPLELWPLRPDEIEILEGTWREPVYKYRYTEQRQIDLPREEVGHAKFFNPTDYFYGMSPLEAAARGVDQFNFAGEWNANMLQNDAVPRAILNMKGVVSDASKKTFKDRYKEHMQGAKNARKNLVVSAKDGIEYVQLALDALEMDWREGIKMSMHQVCMAYGVPPQVVGIPDAQTYANFEQAEKSVWTGPVFGVARVWADHLTHWLLPRFGKTHTRSGRLAFGYDKGDVDALQEDQKEQMGRAVNGFQKGVLTQRQAVKMVGEDDTLAQDAYIWQLDPRYSRGMQPGGDANADAKALMRHAQNQFGARVMAALRAKVAVN